MRYKFVLWGLGAAYNMFLNSIKYYEAKKAIEVVAVSDKGLSGISYIDGYRFISLEDIQYAKYDYIVILSSKYFNEIRNELIEMNVQSSKILSYKFLELPNIDIDKYIMLKNSNISIVSNNCWGGIVYNTLGMECLSPFKNLFLKDNDYLKLLEGLPHYLSYEPVLYKYVVDKSRNIEYPVLLLDDICIHCNHDISAEEAIIKWKRRTKKFNFQNIFVEMYTANKDTAKKFSELDQYPQKVCFVPFAAESPFLMKLEFYTGQKEFWETVNSNAGNRKNCLKYNLVSLLCMEKCIRYI